VQEAGAPAPTYSTSPHVPRAARYALPVWLDLPPTLTPTLPQPHPSPCPYPYPTPIPTPTLPLFLPLPLPLPLPYPYTYTYTYPVPLPLPQVRDMSATFKDQEAAREVARREKARQRWLESKPELSPQPPQPPQPPQVSPRALGPSPKR